MTDATPPFDSYIDALIFAFNASSENYDRPYMNRVAAPAVGSGRGLGGLDGAAQAGMIRAEVRDLGRMREAILLARFAPRWISRFSEPIWSRPCPILTARRVAGRRSIRS